MESESRGLMEKDPWDGTDDGSLWPATSSARVIEVLDPHRVGRERHRAQAFQAPRDGSGVSSGSSRPGSERCYIRKPARETDLTRLQAWVTIASLSR